MALPECLRRAACALLACCSAAALADEPVHSWNFRVYLNHDLIGYHDFTLTSLGAARELRSAAHFLVKVLFINAYHYDHHAAEIWHGDCLERLESHSDDDGKMLSVHVHSVGHELDVEATDAHYSLPGPPRWILIFGTPPRATGWRSRRRRKGAACATCSIDGCGNGGGAARIHQRQQRCAEV